MMVEGVLCEPTPKVKTIEAHGVEEEGGGQALLLERTIVKGVMPSMRIKRVTFQRNILNIKLWSEKKNNCQLRLRKVCQTKTVERRQSINNSR